VKRLVSFLVVALVAAVVPGSALAKGPIEAKIEGPGLASPIRIGDWENFGEKDALAPHQPIMQLAEAAGFFPAAFGEPDVMLDRRPAGELGPRYMMEYRVPGPNNDEFRIVQDLYPYAEPDPVSYMAPNQALFKLEGTRGGWYVADDRSKPALLSVLAEAGLPERPPGVAAEPERFPWGIVLGSALLCVVLVSAAAAWARRRQRRDGSAHFPTLARTRRST
jgi:hypothetical protein